MNFLKHNIKNHYCFFITIVFTIALMLSNYAVAGSNSALSPSWTFDRANKFGLFPGVKVVKPGSGVRSAPFFADLDNDKDLDLIVGQWLGNLSYFENTGTPEKPVWVKKEMFKGLNVGEGSIPAFADLDGDKDLDLAVGSHSGITYYFKNIGTPSMPLWDFDKPEYFTLGGAFTSDLKNAILFREDTAPSFADLDNDGDMDLIIGEHSSRESEIDKIHIYPAPGFSMGYITYFENIGTSKKPVWKENTNMFYELNSHGHHGLAIFADLDKDEDLDLTISYAGTFLAYYENIGTKKTPAWEDKSKLMYDIIGKTDTRRTKDERPIGRMGAWKATLADLDADGDMDLFMGAGSGWVYGFENR